MARPSKYNWDEIRQAYESGATIDYLVKKYDVLKKTLENKISSKKWEVMGEVNSVINDIAEGYGRVSGLKEKFPEKAPIIDDLIEERTKHLTYINNLTLKNLSVMGKKINEDISIFEHKAVQETIDKGAVSLGVADRFAPKNEINNTNAQQNITEIVGYGVKTIEN